MSRGLAILREIVIGVPGIVAIALWVCISLVPLNMATGDKDIGRHIAENVSAGELYRYLPESREVVPPNAKHIRYQSHWRKEFHLAGTRLVQYELSETDFQRAVKNWTNLTKITEPTMFIELDTTITDGWYRRDQRIGGDDLIVFDQSRRQVWRYSNVRAD
jgi:hypothetical protein